MSRQRGVKLAPLVALFALLLGANSCRQEGIIASEYKSISASGWSFRDTLTLHPLLTEATPTHLALELRHNNSYPYQNIWLKVRVKSATEMLFQETLQHNLADAYGSWEGSGWGSLYQLTIPLEQELLLPADSTLQIEVVHGMRDTYLMGIQEVGITLKKQP